jgi:diaminopimelate epimerase
MNRRFHKMHGLGNDFVIFDARDEPVEMDAARARAIADRRTGIGFDQLIVLEPSSVADVRMRIFNADGSEVGACGNVTRCVALLLGGETRIETDGGLISGAVRNGGAVADMGVPRFDWNEIPLAYAIDTLNLPVAWDDLQDPSAVNVGNPHIVFFVDDADAVDLELIGPRIERDPLFPQRINVNVASIGGNKIKLNVWERGTGLTRACGTGACATAVAAIRRRLATSPVEVTQRGGTLQIEWSPGETIRMTGPATHVFAGEIDLEALG